MMDKIEDLATNGIAKLLYKQFDLFEIDSKYLIEYYNNSVILTSDRFDAC